jgi:hypothetical protein
MACSTIKSSPSMRQLSPASFGELIRAGRGMKRARGSRSRF